MKILLPPKGDSIKHPENKQIKCYPKVTRRPPEGHQKANRRPLKGHPNINQMPPEGHPKTTQRSPKGHPKATQRPPKGYPKATFFSFFQSSFNNSYHDDICAIILQYRYYQIHKYDRFLVR